jgi:hypothetical protein
MPQESRSCSCGCVDVGCSVWLEDGCWPSPNAAGITIVFYSLRFQTPRTWKDKSPYLYPPQEYDDPDTPPPRTRFSIRRFVYRRATVKEFELTLEGCFNYWIPSDHTSQEICYVSDTEPNWLIRFWERFAVYCENHAEHIGTLCGHNAARTWPDLFVDRVAGYCENHAEHIGTHCGHNAVRTWQKTNYISATEPNRLMMFGDRVPVYCENHTKHTYTLCWENAVRTSQVTRYFSATESKRLILFGGTVAVYCENRTEHTDTLCGQSLPYRKHITSSLQSPVGYFCLVEQSLFIVRTIRNT